MNESALEIQDNNLIIIAVRALRIFIKYKWFMVLCVLAGAGYGFYKSKDIPYLATTIASLNKTNFPGSTGGSGLKELGLSAIVGNVLSIPMEDPNLKLSIAIMRSRSFAEWTVKKYNLVPKLVPVSIGDAAKDFEAAVNIFQGSLKVNDTTAVNSNIEVIGQHKSRDMAIFISTLAITSINEYLRSLKVKKTVGEIEALNATLENTPYLSVKTYLFSVISQKTTELALTESKEDFFLTVIDPPAYPRKTEKRYFILAIYSSLSLIVGCVLVLLLERMLAVKAAIRDEYRIQQISNR